MGIKISCKKRKLINETLTAELLAVAALEETELESQDETDQNSLYG